MKTFWMYLNMWRCVVADALYRQQELLDKAVVEQCKKLCEDALSQYR